MTTVKKGTVSMKDQTPEAILGKNVALRGIALWWTVRQTGK